MNKCVKLLCLLLVLVMLSALFGCGKHDKNRPDGDDAQDIQPYIGTWKAADHDGENIVHYLIFDENGYWNVFMNYEPLLRAIKQLPEQLVSFKVFCAVQKSGHTGCYYEYVENASFAKEFLINEDGVLFSKEDETLLYEKVSTHSGEPSADVIAEARDLFDRALVEAHSK